MFSYSWHRSARRKARQATRARSVKPRRARAERLETRLLLSAEGEAFVRLAYADLLDRPAEPAGLVYWSGLVDSGSSHAQVALAIQASGEYRSRQVQEAFDEILHRLPEATAVDFYAQLLAEGSTPDQMRAILIGSQEYFQGQGNSDAAFLNSLFLVALDRPIEPSAQTFFGDLLATGASRTQVALIVLASPESDHLQVAGWYQQYLGRSPTANGLDFMAGLLQSGQREQQVIAIIVGSPEYAQLSLNRRPEGPLNIAVTTDTDVQQMPSIVVNPVDPSHVVIAYMDYSLPTADAGLAGEGYAGIGVAVSRDVGDTWQLTSIPLPDDFDEGAANPIARFDDAGHVFVSFMAATFLGEKPPLTNPVFGAPSALGLRSNNGVFVARSDDGGSSWNQSVAVVSHRYTGEKVPSDVIPDLAIDTYAVLPNGQPNPNHGNLYVSWHRNYPAGQFPGHPEFGGGSDIMLAVSRDAGQTWQPRLRDDNGVQVSTIRDLVVDCCGEGESPWGQARLAIGPEGDIYVSNFGGADFTVHHSTDAGASFDGPDHGSGRRVAFGVGFVTLTDLKLPHNNFRTHQLRAIAADPVRPGRVYAADTVQVADASGRKVDAADVFFARSEDYGVTWQQTFRVGGRDATVLNDDNDGQKAIGAVNEQVSSSQAMPRLSVSATGDIGLIWYDARRDPDDHLLDVFGTVSTDGGSTFSPNFRLSDLSLDADRGRFTDATGQENFYIGDFIGLALGGDTAYAAWTDTRSGNQDVFFSRYAIDPAPAPLNDRFEPNDRPANGSPTSLGRVLQRVLPKLTIAPGDEDWFEVTTAATGDLTVSALPAEAAGRLRLELWDEAGTQRLSVGTDSPGVDGAGKQVVFPATAGRTFLVRVLPADGQTRYSLQVRSLTADLGTRAHAIQTGAVATTDDEAFFLIRAPATGSLEVELTARNVSQGPLDLQLLDATTLALIAQGQDVAPLGSRQIVRATAAVREEEQLVVRVSSRQGGQGDFALEFTNRDQYSAGETSTVFLRSGAGPSAVVIGDLNRDGKPDLAVSNALSDTLAVLLGSDTGTFQAPRQFPIGAHRTPPGDLSNLAPTVGRDLVIADFNKDGKADVAVTNYASADVSILLGRGDGTFQPQRRADATAGPRSMEVADFNGDGNPDLVVADETDAAAINVAILLGRDDGTFLPQRNFLLPVGAPFNEGTVSVADFDEDGDTDLAISGSDADGMAIFLGNGDGSFEPGSVFRSGSQTPSSVAADINGDGHVDLAVVSIGGNEVLVHLGNGDGSFTTLVDPFSEQPKFPAGQQPLDVAVADVGSEAGPADGHPDLVLANAGIGLAGAADNGDPEVVFLPAIVDDQGRLFRFGLPRRLAAGEAPQDLVTGDLDDDGFTDDIAVVDRDNVLVIFGQPPNILPNNTRQTARDLGTVVHVVQPTLTITPQNGDDFYRMTVPDEAAAGAGDEVLDFSALFEAQEGPGLAMEVRNAAGDLLGSGERFRVRARQGEELTVHVFGVADGQGNRGAGAYTLVIDVLPQVVLVEAQALLPGVNDQPGGPTTSLVITLQGDRLDTATAENPANYRVTFLGPDRLAGTPDDQVIPLAAPGPDSQPVVYNPGANVDVASGITFPTAVRQTVTLLFADPLPAGSYLIELSPDIQTEAFNADEAGLLAGGAEFGGHPLVQFRDGQLVNGSRQLAVDLVLAAGALGDFSIWETGTPFLTNLHDDLAGLLDSLLTQKGDDPGITAALIDQVLQRFDPALGEPGQRPTDLLVLWLDPVSIDLIDPEGDTVDYDLEDGTLTSTIDGGYVNVGGNVEVVVVPVTTSGTFSLAVSNVPSTARGGAVQLTQTGTLPTSLTNDLRGGTTSFSFTF